MVGSRYEYLASTHTAVLPPAIKFKLLHTLPFSTSIPFPRSERPHFLFAVATSFFLSFPLDWNASPDAEAFRVSLITSHCEKSQIAFLESDSADAAIHDCTHHPSFHSFVLMMTASTNIVLSIISSFPALHFARLSSFQTDKLHLDLL